MLPKIHALAALLLLPFLCAGLARAAAPATTVSGKDHATELWEGKVLTASFRAGMCFAPNGGARGVLLLRHANGNVDVYHLKGVMRNDEFNLSHSSGHFFSGKMTGPDSMEGKVKLKNGMRFTLKGRRHRDVPLLAEDCAPLP